MKQIINRIELFDLMDFAPENPDGTKDGWGVSDGESVCHKLSAFIDQSPEIDILEISLSKIRRLDASFPREAFVILASELVGKKGFFISNISNQVLLDNIRAGADKIRFPVHACCQGKIETLGPTPKRTQLPLYEYVLIKGWVAASSIADVFDLKINNASNKLKELVDEGFLLRKECFADSGGVEFYYFPIATSESKNFTHKKY